ncbi:MAG: hypothetical protein KDC54_13035 [Lewinella sp.]|nr:hypothetical protein [Lewinella sp.]
MRALTQWSHDHPWPARILITILHFTLALAAICLGVLLYGLDVWLPAGVKYGGIALFLLGTLLYPMRKAGFNVLACNYSNSRRMAGLLLVASFIMICGGMNQRVQRVMAEAPTVEYQALPMVLHEGQSARELRRAERQERRELRRERQASRRALRSELRAIVKAMREESSNGQKVLLSILTILGALVLVYLLLALSCSIACSGAEGLAYIVFFAGLGLIIWGVVVVLRRIHGGQPPGRRPGLPTT